LYNKPFDGNLPYPRGNPPGKTSKPRSNDVTTNKQIKPTEAIPEDLQKMVPIKINKSRLLSDDEVEQYLPNNAKSSPPTSKYSREHYNTERQATGTNDVTTQKQIKPTEAIPEDLEMNVPFKINTSRLLSDDEVEQYLPNNAKSSPPRSRETIKPESQPTGNSGKLTVRDANTANGITGVLKSGLIIPLYITNPEQWLETHRHLMTDEEIYYYFGEGSWFDHHFVDFQHRKPRSTSYNEGPVRQQTNYHFICFFLVIQVINFEIKNYYSLINIKHSTNICF
jgi:hypothetical protein